jgi:nucleoside-diphosphate-sugar epimerase
MSLVLITGATGFIGSQVALRTLEAGFNVRLVVRREDQADKLRRIFAEHQDKITFVTSAAFRELYLVYVRGAPPTFSLDLQQLFGSEPSTSQSIGICPDEVDP